MSLLIISFIYSRAIYRNA